MMCLQADAGKIFTERQDVIMDDAAAVHNVYSVFFLDGSGRLIDEPRRVAHGQSAQPPDYTPPQGLSFVGWSRDTDLVTEDVYCVALTQQAETPLPAPPQKEAAPQICRVYVLDVRSSCPGGTLLPLGNWNVGETISREDLACLHLRHSGRLRPFRVLARGDTMLALTDHGVQAYERGSMRPIELLELVPETWTAQALSAA